MHVTMPEVSAVIPTRNRPEWVYRAMQSVLSQTHQNIEAIVVIDGPDPETESALKALRDPRVQVIALTENVGGSEARNIGIRAARGEWIGLLDDDDLWLPRKIEQQLNRAKQSNARYPVISSRVLGRTDKGDYPLPKLVYDGGQPVGDYLFCRNGFSNSNGLLQTSTLLAPRVFMLLQPFRRGLKKHQDWDWILRAAQHPDCTIVMLPEVLSVFDMAGVRKSVSRALAWKFSADWAREMRPFLSTRAYSHFIAIYCVCSAASEKAGPGVYLQLFRMLIKEGRFSLGAFGRFALYSLFPASFREWVRQGFTVKSRFLSR
jgi:hypothetical protein